MPVSYPVSYAGLLLNLCIELVPGRGLTPLLMPPMDIVLKVTLSRHIWSKGEIRHSHLRPLRTPCSIITTLVELAGHLRIELRPRGLEALVLPLHQ